MAGGSMSQGRGREAFEGFITTDFSFLSLILGLPWCRKIISRRYFQNKHTKDETERQSWQPWWKLENQRHRVARMHSWVVDCRTLKDATQFLGSFLYALAELWLFTEWTLMTDFYCHMRILLLPGFASPYSHVFVQQWPDLAENLAPGP